MRRKVTTRLRGPLERDVALAIKVRKDNCPSMGVFPESVYEEIEYGIRLARGDYDLMIFVANWPSRRVDAWDALLKARAIENQCYVAAVNRIGVDGTDTPYCGHSAIYGAARGRTTRRLRSSTAIATCMPRRSVSAFRGQS